MCGIWSFAQSRLDTTKKIKLSQNEIWALHNNLINAYNIIHRQKDMKAGTRDTIDSFIAPFINEIESRYQKAKSDTAKKTTK